MLKCLHCGNTVMQNQPFIRLECLFICMQLLNNKNVTLPNRFPFDVLLLLVFFSLTEGCAVI